MFTTLFALKIAGLVVTTEQLISAGLQYFGNWRIFDASPVAYTFGASAIDGTASQLAFQLFSGTLATTGAPVALATGDSVSVQITYLRA